MSGVVLLIEDEDAVRRVAAAVLRREGFEVLEADGGPAAHEIVAARGRDISVILSDVIMPGISGPALVKELRPLAPGAKVLFTSGYARTSRASELRNEAFLPKPFTAEELTRAVREMIDEDDAGARA